MCVSFEVTFGDTSPVVVMHVPGSAFGTRSTVQSTHICDTPHVDGITHAQTVRVLHIHDNLRLSLL